MNFVQISPLLVEPYDAALKEYKQSFVLICLVRYTNKEFETKERQR